MSSMTDRPTQHTSFVRYSWVFSAIAALFLVNAFIGYRAQLAADENMQAVVDANGNLLRLRRIQLLILNAETGQRGFILTQESAYRIPYDAALIELDTALASLDESLRETDVPTELRAAFNAAIAAKRGELESTLAYAQANDFAAAERIMEADAGQQYMDDIRDSGQAINDELVTSIIEAQDAFRRSNNQSRVTLMVSVIASVLLLAGFLYLLRVDFRHRENMHRVLEQHAGELEHTVRARTAELESLNERYRSSNEELESFAYVVSHDLQEPLRKIQAFGDRLATRYEDALDEGALDYISRMRNAASRMSTLLNDLLEFSRVNTRGLKLVDVDLNRKLVNVLDDLEVTISNSKALVTADEMPTIRADAVQMRQLFQNLIANAIKFSDPQTRPEVRISCTVSDDADAPSVELRFADNGIGFDEEYKDRIFTPFQRLHQRGEYPGTGIGLAICRRICERHGGGIDVSSEPGVGSTFVATLALNPEAANHFPATPKREQ